MNKNELRKFVNNQSIDKTRNRFEEKYLLKMLLDFIETKKPTCLGLYAAILNEVDLKSIFKIARTMNISIAYPRIEDEQIIFHTIDSLDLLVPTLPYGLYEPVAWAQLATPDVLVVPGIGFTKCGKRLGRGKGFYDCYLSKHNPCTISLALSWQLLDDIPTEPHDVLIQHVISYPQNINEETD